MTTQTTTSKRFPKPTSTSSLTLLGSSLLDPAGWLSGSSR